MGLPRRGQPRWHGGTVPAIAGWMHGDGAWRGVGREHGWSSSLSGGHEQLVPWVSSLLATPPARVFAHHSIT